MIASDLALLILCLELYRLEAQADESLSDAIQLVLESIKVHPKYVKMIKENKTNEF